uniref:DUF4179 domain-containing protein n=1 Tax=Acetatifactor sp. TaxID=1872090 RepID=UPI004057A99D
MGLVNLSSPIATACSNIPLLRELVNAVSFSDSLSAAVTNDYVQTLSLSRTDNDITATVEYLIVDKKQVTVFFRLDTNVYTEITADPVVLSADGERDSFCSYDLNNYETPMGELQSITIDFGQEDVPDSLYLEMNIRDQNDIIAGIAPADINAYMMEQELSDMPEYFAHFSFLLEFNPNLSAKPKVYPINQTMILDGNEITFTNVEIYPSHLRLNTIDSAKNNEWINTLDFYVKTEDGKKFERPLPGVYASGIRDSITGTSTMYFKTESPYFYESDSFEIVIQGATWCDKETQETIREWKAKEPITIIVE